MSSSARWSRPRIPRCADVASSARSMPHAVHVAPAPMASCVIVPNRTVLGNSRPRWRFRRVPPASRAAISSPLPDSIPDEIAVFIEPLAAACEIFEQIKIPRNHRVLVLGDGRLGALVAMAMKAEGYDVIVGGTSSRKDERSGLLSRHEKDLNDRFDVVVDCTGSNRRIYPRAGTGAAARNADSEKHRRRIRRPEPRASRHQRNHRAGFSMRPVRAGTSTRWHREKSIRAR